MKRGTTVLLALLVLVASLYLFQRYQNGIRQKLWITLNQLSRRSFGSLVTEVPWTLDILVKYAQLAVYHDADLTLPAHAANRVVFFGDSITEQWDRLYPSEFFPGKGYIGRGISGQLTKQMAWRFRQDVLQLHPRTVVILAGTNDVYMNELLEQLTKKHFRNMVQMARRHGIQVVLCSMPPLTTPASMDQRAVDARVTFLNGWLRQYAAEQHLPFIDYYSALHGPSGHMPPELTRDGIHPSLEGYAVMRRVAQSTLDATPPK